MHELQMAGDLMRTVLLSIEGRNDITKVEEVHLTIGRLSMLGEEQLRFCWEAITAEEALLKGSVITVSYEEGEVRCRSCGHTGPLKVESDPAMHRILPVFACPLCGCGVDIVKGRSVVVNGIRAISDGGETPR